MMIPKTLKFYIPVLCGLAMLASVPFAHGQVAELDSSILEDSGFDFGSFEGDGAVTHSADFFTVDVSAFGGVGANADQGSEPINFSNSESVLEVEVRLGPNNTATDFRIILVDDDGTTADGITISEQYQYFVSLDGATTEEFTVVTIDLENSVFNSDGFEADPNDDGVINYGLTQIQVQSTFGSTERTNIDIARVSIVSTSATVAGDFDGNDVVDGDDVDFYIGNLGQPATGALAQLDLDDDETVTLADHNLHVTTLVTTSNGFTGALLGDVNLDGSVSVLVDALTLVGTLGQMVSSRSAGDLNADGIVTVLGDALILVGDLGQSNESAASSSAP